MDKIIIGKRVRRHREAQNLTREMFAEKVGISSQFLAEIENATKGMSTDTLYKICEQGQASADYILFGKTGSSAMSPSVAMLNEIPPQYSILIEDIIRTFKDAIDISNGKNERQP